MPTIPFYIERVTVLSDEALQPLVDDCVLNGHNMVRRLVQEWGNAVNQFHLPGEALFIAKADDPIVGVCGLNVDPFADNGHVGRVRRLYVHHQYRRLGIGRALVQTVIEAAQGRFHALHVRTYEPAAVALYEAMGFTPVTDIDRCTHMIAVKQKP